MSFIKSRKHASPLQAARIPSLAVAGALLLPVLGAHAQTSGSGLPPTRVDAARESAYKSDYSASPKYTEPLVDTPQTLQILRRPLMAQQAATSLSDVLRNTPGVGAFFLGENGSTSTGDTIYMRGFDATGVIFVDNVRDLGAVSRDVFNIEQVEVLKGQAGTDNGRGSPTGSINLVTKQPELVDAVTVSATYGSWNQKRATLDWNRILDADRGLALRLNLMTQHSGVPGRHVVHNARDGFAPSLAFGLNTPTRIFFNYLHIQQDNVPDGGVSTIGLVSATGENFLAYAPRRSFTSWASWRLPQGFTLGGGLRYSGGLLRGRDTNAIGTPKDTGAYWVADVMASYVIHRHAEIQLNVNNLFNNSYVRSINKSGYRYLPGDARNISLTGNFHF
ncbi:TonB-dependent receptor domain-containing protein [Herbaspirillum seropedicae]|uniref:TonB-dependent receptor domain-containing protein n=1 Tax=Herbaspirillum seropedicae TaxID=964 RepID=UPI003F8D7A96